MADPSELGSGVGRVSAAVPAVVLVAAPENAVWTVTGKQGPWRVLPDPVMRCSSLIMVRDAVRAGAGAASLPRSMVKDDLAAGRLVSWGVTDREVALWVLHTSRRLVSSKVTVFVKYLCDAFPEGTF